MTRFLLGLTLAPLALAQNGHFPSLTNIGAGIDTVRFQWKKISGDAAITVLVEQPGSRTKALAGPMLRATLDPDSPLASVIVLPDARIALAFRRTPGGPIDELPIAAAAPARVKLSRSGDVISLEAGTPNGPLQPGAALTVTLPEDAYAGLAAASNTRTRSFPTATLEEDGPVAPQNRAVESTLETVDIATGERRIVYRALQHFEAPNWTPDGQSLIFNSGGKIYRIPVTGGTPVLIPTGEVRCNNDHGISPDGKWLAISGSLPRGQSQIFIVPITGGEPRLVTPQMPSYWHGWSPDGKTLAYCASRNGEYDIYTIPAAVGPSSRLKPISPETPASGPPWSRSSPSPMSDSADAEGSAGERRLTTAKGLDDGPEYSPDGTQIYFNSVRSGLMRIWAMDKDGANQRMISKGPEAADWFAHFSPDGKWIAYISYDKSVEGHPANKDVVLNLARADGSNPRALVTLFGGQGTMNVPNWSPGSTHFAFVSYRLVKKNPMGKN